VYGSGKTIALVAPASTGSPVGSVAAWTA
jgi:hypothetical protein